MKKKPDILVVLAVVLGLGITLSSVGDSGESEAQVQVQQAAQQQALNSREDKRVARNR